MSHPSATIRKFFLCLLVIPYTAYIVGMFSSYITFYHRSAFQAQVAASNEPNLKQLALSAVEFKKINWTEAGREFEYSGKMYDVSKIEKHGEHYIVYCENDSLEDMFIDWLKSASKSKSKVMPQIQFVEPIIQLECNFIACEIRPEIIFRNSYSSFRSELIPPPPRS